MNKLILAFVLALPLPAGATEILRLPMPGERSPSVEMATITGAVSEHLARMPSPPVTGAFVSSLTSTEDPARASRVTLTVENESGSATFVVVRRNDSWAVEARSESVAQR